MVLDRSGRVLITNNLETFVCDGSDNGLVWSGYVANCFHQNVQFCRYLKYLKGKFVNKVIVTDHQKDVRAKFFLHLFHYETFTTVRWWVSYVRNVKTGCHRLRFGPQEMPAKHRKSEKKNRASFANKATHSICKPQNILITSLEWNVLCQILFSGPIKCV